MNDFFKKTMQQFSDGLVKEFMLEYNVDEYEARKSLAEMQIQQWEIEGNMP